MQVRKREREREREREIRGRPREHRCAVHGRLICSARGCVYGLVISVTSRVAAAAAEATRHGSALPRPTSVCACPPPTKPTPEAYADGRGARCGYFSRRLCGAPRLRNCCV